MKDLPAVPARMLEAQDKTQQVQREGQHPQQWNGNDFLAKLVGRRHQQRRCACRQKKPQNSRRERRGGPCGSSLVCSLCCLACEGPRTPGAPGTTSQKDTEQ